DLLVPVVRRASASPLPQWPVVRRTRIQRPALADAQAVVRRHPGPLDRVAMAARRGMDLRWRSLGTLCRRPSKRRGIGWDLLLPGVERAQGGRRRALPSTE